MRAINAELLAERPGRLKFILNDAAIVFFPAEQQHRDVKADGLSYEDDYRGNALAGIIMPNKVEIRFHNAYSVEHVKGIWSRVLQIPEVAAAGPGPLYYQGKAVH